MRLIFILFLLMCSTAMAAERPEDKEISDTVDVASGLPLSIDDASTQEYHTWSSQFATHFQHGGNEEKSVSIAPEVQYGIFKNTEFSLTIPYVLERIDGTHNNNVQTGLKYNFVEESKAIPALSIEQDINFPTAEKAAGLNFTTQLFLTKHILPQYGVTAFYLNGSWSNSGHPDEDDRHNVFSVASGFSHAVTKHTAIVADLVEQQEDDKYKNDTLAEIGFRQFINKELILSFGTGTGLNRNAPDFELNAGLEYGF